MTGLLIALTIGLPWIGAVAVWAVGDYRARLQHRLAVGFAVSAAVTALLLLTATTDAVELRLVVGGIFGDFTFVPDGLAVLLTVIAAVIGGLAVIFSMDYMRGEAGLGRYYALVLLFIGAMAGLVLASNLLLMFLFWEMTALCSYALISFYNDDPKAVAGGVKALIMTQIGGLGLLIGVLAARASLGSYDISALLEGAHTLAPETLALIAFGFLVAAAAKSAQVPFQTWLPGAMEAPTPVSALIHAATMVNAGVYLLIRFYPAFEGVPGWTTAVMLVGLVSALLAALLAVVAKDLKRALAYSTVSQLGYMVYAVGVGGVFAAQFHLFSHAVFKALLFLGAGAVIHAAGTRDMWKMGGLGKEMPFTRNTFVIGALALMGLPILNGFWSKELILEAGLHAGPNWAFAGMVFGAGLTALYTFRMVWLVFFGPRRSEKHVHDAGQAMRFALGVLAVGTLTTWLLVGSVGACLSCSVPAGEEAAHAAPALGEMVSEVLAAPATWLALAVIVFGLFLGWQREPLSKLVDRLGLREPYIAAAERDFGFAWINRQVVRAVQSMAERLRAVQTGQLNWNALGIVGALVVVLIVLLAGRG